MNYFLLYILLFGSVNFYNLKLKDKSKDSMIQNHTEIQSKPILLLELEKFNNRIANGSFFSEGFQLNTISNKTILKTYSEEKDFLNSIYVFAMADGSGSVYAYWKRSKNIENNPVVIFGSEGGYHVVAKNTEDLLRILTLDSEPHVDWEVINYSENIDNNEPSEYINEYCKWLKENYNISKINNASKIIDDAQRMYKKEFEKWMSSYYN